ncbi:MAG: hypothetical protein HY816_15850 [Candidatus Wallbacteria bacterium]|nr:hypothetical protein [Candidatus Wallbacteria bacterium]
MQSHARLLTGLFLLQLATVLTVPAAAADLRKHKFPGAERLRVRGVATVYDAAGQPKSGRDLVIPGDVLYADHAAGGAPAVEPETSRYARIAAHWAPVVLQDTDDTNTAADWLTPVDYDGDWNTRNNWENLERWRSPVLKSLAQSAVAYWWVVETPTHWFVGYAFYHPRDWDDSHGLRGLAKTLVYDPIQSLRGKGDGEHENDLEGALLTVRKEGGTWGRLELMDTQAHNHFWQYGPKGVNRSIESDGKKRETIDAEIAMDAGRPCVFIEAKGHGNYGSRSKTKFDGKKGDGTVYEYASDGRASAGRQDYALVPMSLLWESWKRAPGHRSETWSQKAGRAAFAGDSHTPDAANPPWAWVDTDYPAWVNDCFFANPARFVAWRFENAAGKAISTIVTGRSWR